MFSLLFIILASVCNSVMDVISFHYEDSVFNDPKDQKWNAWWDPNRSWRNKYKDKNPRLGLRKLFWIINYPVQLTDAWHLFKMFMIVFICLGIVSYSVLISPIIDFCVLGIIWNITFSLFYSQILVKK